MRRWISCLFPVIAADVGAYEDAPMNSLHIPGAPATRRRRSGFSPIVLRADVQEALNRAICESRSIARPALPTTAFSEQGGDLLARADGLAQYFDRDTDEELATIAMKGFQEFMLRPERLDAILANIERARERIYGQR